MELPISVKEFSRSSANSKDLEKENVKKISEFRIGSSQFLANTAANFLMLQQGMALQFSSIVIPILLEAESGLKFTKEQASWFGSILYIFQPIGSITSGFLSNAWGRKRTMLLDNFPFILGWFLMYTAYDLYQLYTAVIVLGLAIGFKAAPFLNYAGEVCQPKWRGALTQYYHIYTGIGYFLMSLIGALTDWQTAAAIASSVSMLALILIAFIPESPAWLLSKGREEDARKSLSWLRGWVQPENIKDEFQDLVKCNASLHELKENRPEDLRGGKNILRFLEINDLLRNDVLRPLILVDIFLTITHITGIQAMGPYVVQIFEVFGSSIDSYWCSVINTVVGISANLIGSLTVRKLGKRVMCHISFLAGATCFFFMSLYGFVFIGTGASWIPVSLYFLSNFLFYFGIGTIPWQLISEVFPFQGRSLASGISSAFNNLVTFIATKTYYDLTYAFTLPGCFAFFGVANILGWIFFYFLIPETEGKSLEEVQITYANVLRKKNNQDQGASQARN